MQQKRLATLTRRVFIVWDEKGLQRRSYHSVGYWNCLKTSQDLLLDLSTHSWAISFSSYYSSKKKYMKDSFKLFSHQLLTTMKYNISVRRWQAANEDTWNKCMMMCQTGCQQSTNLHVARDRGPWHEGHIIEDGATEDYTVCWLWDFRNHLPDKQPRNLSQAITQKGMKRGRLLILKHKLLPHSLALHL